MVTRRNFLKICAAIGTAATIELYSADIRDIFTQAIEAQAQGDTVRVIWLAGAQDTGCTISLLQGSDPDLIDVITKFKLQIDFHQTLMIPEGEKAIKRLEDVVNDKSRVDLLIMEGAIPEG
ncbi:MAG: twin-arginine translocation signal domain-containing protein, partial [Candidatus Bathyarchaeia archaeon]